VRRSAQKLKLKLGAGLCAARGLQDAGGAGPQTTPGPADLCPGLHEPNLVRARRCMCVY